jgi:hypothetical protein
MRVEQLHLLILNALAGGERHGLGVSRRNVTTARK